MRLLSFILPVLLVIVGVAACAVPPAEKEVVVATLPTRIHVLLANNADPTTILKAFPNVDLKSLGQASRSQNKYAFTFNAALISIEDLKVALNKRDDVLQVDVLK